MKKNVHVISMKVEGKEWEDSLDAAFKKKVKNTRIDGFRKGAIPKSVYIKKFGIETLFMDAVDIAVGAVYSKAIKENNIVPVCEPKIDIKKIDKDHVEFEFTFITKPEVELTKYTKLGVKKDAVKVTKAEVDEEVKRLRTQYADIAIKSEGKVEDGDTAVIDFEGFVDGKPLEGGSGSNYPLEIGSHTFIPGFEEGLIGMEVNEEKELNLTFPENYTEELKGKDVLFKVTLVEIKERVLPELNEEFYKDLGYNDVKSEEEFREEIKGAIKERKDAAAEDKYINDCLEEGAKNMKIDLNEEIIDEEVHRMIHQFEDQLKMQGLTMDHYMEFTHQSHEDLHKQMEPEATRRVKYRYLLETIAEKENFEITDEEADSEAEKMATEYGVTKDEFLNGFGGMDVVKYDIRMHKAIDLLKAN